MDESQKLIDNIKKKFGDGIIHYIKSKKYNITKLLGMGSFGTVYLLCKNKGCNRVLKLQNRTTVEDYQNEIFIFKKFSDLKLGPKLYKHKLVDNVMILEMDFVNPIINSIIKDKKKDKVIWNEETTTTDHINIDKDQIVEHFKAFLTHYFSMVNKEDLFHGDFALTNIGFIGNASDIPKVEDFKVYDFGLSDTFDEYNDKGVSLCASIDLSSYIRRYYIHGIHEKYLIDIRNHCEKIFKRLYPDEYTKLGKINEENITNKFGNYFNKICKDNALRCIKGMTGF